MPYRLLVSFVLIALLAAVATPARSADTVQVNVILALTGSAAPIGQVEHTSLEIFAKRINATVKEVKGSHAVYVAQPRAVASLIEQAASTAPTK